jgi:HPt (histidine-containing phosphotransfer) domain-containing protein
MAGSVGHMGVLDPEVVDQLRALAQAGNSDLLHRLQSSFARDTPGRVSALRAGLAAGDAAAVAFNVHTLKGSAANLGAREVVATCEQIEDASTAATERGLEPLLAQLERNAADAQAELALLAETG